ncbi:MAG: mechanosensitive ion channel family protein [Myxococcales bacterium]|nr:mechanosensitive ion channel family protein [Myxococcales bacterium]
MSASRLFELISDVGPYKPLLTTLFVLLGFFMLRRLMRKAMLRTIDEPARRYTVSKLISYGLGTLAVLLIAQAWISESVDFGTWLGLLSAGLAIAFRDPLVNMAAWIFLLIRQPFKVGDRIELGDVKGDVVDIGPLTFSLLEIGNWVHDDQSTGRIVHVPNGIVFQKTVASYTHGFEYIWNELHITVTFESDWSKARDVLTEIVWRQSERTREEVEKQIARTAQKYMIHYRHLTPIVWVALEDNGVCLSVRYLCPARKRRSSAHDLWMEILGAFAKEAHIDFAYPTQRFYVNDREGKSAFRPNAAVQRAGDLADAMPPTSGLNAAAQMSNDD